MIGMIQDFYYDNCMMISPLCLYLQSDVWALGCCVYEMATLKHAFNAKDMNSLVYRIVEGKVLDHIHHPFR